MKIYHIHVYKFIYDFIAQYDCVIGWHNENNSDSATEWEVGTMIAISWFWSVFPRIVNHQPEPPAKVWMKNILAYSNWNSGSKAQMQIVQSIANSSEVSSAPLRDECFVCWSNAWTRVDTHWSHRSLRCDSILLYVFEILCGLDKQQFAIFLWFPRSNHSDRPFSPAAECGLRCWLWSKLRKWGNHWDSCWAVNGTVRKSCVHIDSMCVKSHARTFQIRRLRINLNQQ